MNCKGCKHCKLLKADEWVETSYYCDRPWAMDEGETISQSWRFCKGRFYEKEVPLMDMKVTELQINDLVGYNGIIGRVYATSMPFPRKEERYNDKAIITLAVDGFIDALESEVEPIPLTTEILEKNGFHTNYDHTLLGSRIYHRMCGKYNEYEVVVRMLNGWIKIKSHDDRVTDILAIDIQPRFVHQLQHALRLGGLNELADNFKIYTI